MRDEKLIDLLIDMLVLAIFAGILAILLLAGTASAGDPESEARAAIAYALAQLPCKSQDTLPPPEAVRAPMPVDLGWQPSANGWHYYRTGDGIATAAWHADSGYWRRNKAGVWVEWLDEGVSRKAVPFDSKAGAADADKDATGPWLPESEQRYVRSIMPAGVPLGGVKFYRLPQRFQSLYTMNGGQPHRDVLPVTNERDPWRVSGGMHNVPRDGWRNVTGLDLAGGKIDVWEEWQDVGAFGPVPKVRWKFPDGTRAYDVLLKVDGAEEHVFEVRVHEKHAGQWDAGTAYRPEPAEVTGRSQGWTWGFADVGIEADSTVYAARFAERPKFVEVRKVYGDGGAFVPKDYLGAGTACMTCHRRAGERTGYATGRRGEDGRFSFHIFRPDGSIDDRWPINHNEGVKR